MVPLHAPTDRHIVQSTKDSARFSKNTHTHTLTHIHTHARTHAQRGEFGGQKSIISSNWRRHCSTDVRDSPSPSIAGACPTEPADWKAFIIGNPLKKDEWYESPSFKYSHPFFIHLLTSPAVHAILLSSAALLSLSPPGSYPAPAVACSIHPFLYYSSIRPRILISCM